MTVGKRMFLGGLVVSLCLTAALAIGTVLFGEFDDEGARIVYTTILLALPAGVLLDHGRAPAARLGGDRHNCGRAGRFSRRALDGAALEALARHGVKADVASRPRV